MQTNKTPQIIIDAQRVANNPHAFRDRPSLRSLALLALQSNTGRPCRQTGPRAFAPTLITPS